MRILLAEDSTLFRQGLRTLLMMQPEIEVVAEAADGWEAVTEARRLSPDLVILGIGTPSSPGLDHLKQIREDAPDARVLVLADFARESDLWQALRRGASGFILKSSNSEELFRAIGVVMKGELAISASVSGNVLRGMALAGAEPAGARSQLTPREAEVLRLLASGSTDRDISQQLSLSVSTVRHHVHNVLRKLNLRNRVQAATMAGAGGLPQERELEGKKWTNGYPTR